MGFQISYIYDNKSNILKYEKLVLDLFKEKFRKALKENKKLSIYCAVGYFFFEGLAILIRDLEELYNKGLLKKFKLVMGGETKATTKEVLLAIKSDASKLKNEEYKFIKKLYDEGIFEFRIYLDRAFHIKLYLFEENDVLTDVWAGSANLTPGGLKDNIELVVPTGVSSEDREIYKEFFDKIWEDSTDEVEKLKTIDIIKSGASTKAIYLPPREFFANLIKLMGKEYLLSNPSLEVSYLAEFQHMSYFMCLEKLNKWGGVILANSVGLGKTDVACVVAKYYVKTGKKVLIIYPSTIKNQWIKTLRKSGLTVGNDVALLSMGLLQRSEFNVHKYKGFDLIIVDEAHNFRNTSSNRRKNLDELIKINQNCHTLLITATPINTSLKDYISLLEIFISKEKYRERFESEGFLNKIQAAKQLINQSENDNIVEIVKILRHLIKEFTIRLEWTDILKYFKKDLEKIAQVNDFKMPTVERVEYNYNRSSVNKIFNKVVDYLAELNYEYTKLWDEEGYKEDKNLIFWYKWRLYKRLESSIYAFKKSLKNFKDRNEHLLKIFDKIDKNERINNKLLNTTLFEKERLERIILTYKSLKNEIKEKIKTNIKEDIKETESMLSKTVLAKFKIEPEDFEEEQKYPKNIEILIKELIKLDKKVKNLIKILKKEKKPTIIFSESKDTVTYLEKVLKTAGFDKIGVAYSDAIDKKDIQEEFNNGKYDILITTDVLSEGVNLSRADIVINFDLPYNPVRLIQRAGRAIRLNNPKHIKIYNFKPDKNIDKELELCDKLNIRVENIIATIGIEFIIWSIEKEKLEEFSDRNRKRVEDAIKKWKEKLSSSNLENLSKIVESTLDEIDKTLKDFITHYNISKETIEKYYYNYRKPIYTSFVSDKNGYFVLFKYRFNNYYCGELYFSTNDRKIDLKNSDFTKIENLIKNKIEKMDEEFLKTGFGKDKLTLEIEKFAKEYGSKLEALINSYHIETLPKNEKEKLLNLLKQKENVIFKKDKIEEIKEFLEQIKENISNEDTPTILAIIRYVKER